MGFVELIWKDSPFIWCQGRRRGEGKPLRELSRRWEEFHKGVFLAVSIDRVVGQMGGVSGE